VIPAIRGAGCAQCVIGVEDGHPLGRKPSRVVVQKDKKEGTETSPPRNNHVTAARKLFSDPNYRLTKDRVKDRPAEKDPMSGKIRRRELRDD